MTVGAYEAKTHLSQLLDEVAEGKTITITRHGVPVALLVPVSQTSGRSQRNVSETIEELKAFRRGNRLDGLTIRELIEEGRRY